MYVGGSRGLLTGVQLYDLIILSARRKLRNKLATSRSCRNNFWNKSETHRMEIIQLSLESRRITDISRRDYCTWEEYRARCDLIRTKLRNRKKFHGGKVAVLENNGTPFV